MVKKLTMDDFMRIMLTAWPNAVVDEGRNGELIVFTGVRNNKGTIEEIDLDEPY